MKRRLVRLHALDAISVTFPFVGWRVINSLRSAIAGNLAGDPVVILGAQKVGKSSLAGLLEGGELETFDNTGVGNSSSRKLTTGNVRAKTENIGIQDISGHDGLGYPTWRKAFLEADHVWYLFRADLIASGDASEAATVKEHLDMFKGWIDGNHASPPKILLVGTFADLAPSYADDPATFRNAIADSQPIAVGRVKLNDADLIIGSIASIREAAKLIKALRDRLERPSVKRTARLFLRKFGKRNG